MRDRCCSRPRTRTTARGCREGANPRPTIALFRAGHESTANTLAWALFLPADHPEVGAKLQVEAVRLIPVRPQERRRRMGFTLVPIAIELNRLAAALGSGDKRLLSAVVRRYRGEFEQIDDAAAEFCEDEDLDGAFTVQDALRQMVNGEAYRRERGLGFVYGYALHLLCLHLGEELPNGWWRTTSGWPVKQHVDRALAAAGVAEGVLRTRLLIERGPPVPLPEIEDYPSVGYLRVGEARVALTVLPEAVVAAVVDPDIRGAIGVLRGWLCTCMESERDLICFES